MSVSETEQRVYRVALLACVATAVGTVFTDETLEATLLMATTVIAGLLCFDAAMEGRLRSRGPWILVSIAPIFKTVPLVWFELRASSGLLIERYDHAGSVLFGICILGAIVLLSRPAPELGSKAAFFDGAVVVGAGLSAATAGASVAYAVDRAFGASPAARILETSTWFVLGALLAALTLAAAHAPMPSLSLIALLASSAVTAGLLAYTVAGGTIDRGWWALLFVTLAVSAVGVGPGSLGDRASRTRRSPAQAVVAAVVGLIAAGAAISARSDPSSSWGPGWWILGILAIAMFATALARGNAHHVSDSALIDLAPNETVAHAQARERAMMTLRSGTSPTQPEPAAPTEPEPQPLRSRVERVEESTFAARLGGVSFDSLPEPGQQKPVVQQDPQPPSQSVAQPAPAPEPVMSPPVPAPASQPVPEPVIPPLLEPVPTPAELVPLTVTDSAHAPIEKRHDLAPLEQAHYFDPSTGLLSAAGLQRALVSAFAAPRPAGHVTMMLFTIRDLDQIEESHGRLVSASVTREVAERVAVLLPRGTGARFARSAFAVIFLGDLGDSASTVQRLARVLLQLRAQLSGGLLGDKIDVVAGMAQCYEGEDVSQFVARANVGLARAVQTAEPTFVAMP